MSDSENHERRYFAHVDTDGLEAIHAANGRPCPPGVGDFYQSAVENSLEAFAKAGVKATYFVIAADLDDADRRAALATVLQEGHHVSGHGMHHRLLDQIPNDLKREEIFAGKAKIEDTLGVEVRGFRAPGFSIDRTSIEMLAEAGYRYDGSIIPSPERCRELGFEGSLEPFPLAEGLIETPMPWVGRYHPRFHPCYAFYLRMPYFRMCLRRYAARSRVMTLLFHFTDFADPHPAVSEVRTRIFSNNYFSRAAKLRFVEGILDEVHEHFKIDTTERFLGTYQGTVEVPAS